MRSETPARSVQDGKAGTSFRELYQPACHGPFKSNDMGRFTVHVHIDGRQDAY